MSSIQCAYGISELNYFNENVKLKKKLVNFIIQN